MRARYPPPPDVSSPTNTSSSCRRATQERRPLSPLLASAVALVLLVVGGGGASLHRRHQQGDRRRLQGLGTSPALPQVHIDERGAEEGGARSMCWAPGEDENGLPLPHCYSAPDANPSKGAWQRCVGGVNESPADLAHWAHPAGEFGFLRTCQALWNQKHEGEGVRPYWAWKPDNCSLETVTAAKFCRVMEGRKGLLLVGDSLTRLFTTTLASVLRAKTVTASSNRDIWRACGDKITITFARNDYLDLSTTAFPDQQCKDKNGKPTANTRCTVFAKEETLRLFDTLVVNSGAHPRPFEEYGPAMRESSRVLSDIMRRLHGDDAILVARNTPPGHSGCTPRVFKGPVDIDVATALAAAGLEKYKWDAFEGYNELLEKAFDPSGGWNLLDAYSPTVLRADSHIGGNDCLHYCVPGPADHWVTLLYNILLAETGVDPSDGGEGSSP